VFAWEERAVESSRLMFERMQHYLGRGAPGGRSVQAPDLA